MSPRRTSTPYTQRVEVGAYYTDGDELWEVTEVCALGAVTLRNAHFLSMRSLGIDAFRRQFWLVKEPGSSSPAGPTDKEKQ